LVRRNSVWGTFLELGDNRRRMYRDLKGREGGKTSTCFCGDKNLYQKVKGRPIPKRTEVLERKADTFINA